jgi:hypothetical protein
MAYRKEITIWCDSCEFNFIRTHKEYPKQAKEHAKANGWKILGDGHYHICPSCIMCRICDHYKITHPTSDSPYTNIYCNKGHWEGIEDFSDLEVPINCKDFKVTK